MSISVTRQGGSSPNEAGAWAPSSLEATCCPVCGSDGGIPHYVFEPFRVVRCRACGCAYLNPRVTEEEIARLYRAGYFASADSGAHGYADYAALEGGLRPTFQRRYRFVRPYVRGGRAVELGCAMGYALDCLRDDFEERIGIDLAPEAIDEVRRRGHRGILGTLEAASLEPQSASLFLAMDTIEHLYDPRAAVAEIARILRPGGVLAVVTPDYDSLLRRLSGRNWVSFKIPEHVTYFSRRSMTDVLARSSLDVIRYVTDFQYSPVGLILDRASKVLPRAAGLSRRILGPLVGMHRFVPVYNGMFLVIARKRNP